MRASAVRTNLERYFEFASLQTTWRTEILAGLTTFMTMAYIVFVNPAILHEAGIPFEGVVAATCIAAAVGSILMGVIARYPIALAPGMGLNAYFTYTVVKGMGIPWEVALGAVFLSGVAFLALTALGIRQLIVAAIPKELHAAVAAGVGLFIAFIGLRSAGIVVANPATLVGLGDLHNANTLLAVFGLILISALLCARVNAAILIGVVTTWLLGSALGVFHFDPKPYSFTAITATAGKLQIGAATAIGFAEIVFVFLFVDLFDNVGTLLAVGTKAGLFRNAEEVPRLNRILYCDAIATITGAVSGTSTVVSYIESSAGVAAGGRSGVTAIVTGMLFAIALFVAPLAGAIPAAATAPALIAVGSMMMTSVSEIPWADPEIAIPAFLVLLGIPLTFSIANGLALGFTAWTLIRILRGRFREVHWMVYVLTALFIARFAWLRAA